ncbi:vp80 [Leucania separata nucleopolyhedrovirus]|uniref:Vp80 n=1 Tax=Leucania separata nucleopolyhedrovirus TaxID=1307956 RepID=Q0IL10_NPVLS|nr:vp80 [Leucania separata nucleopolyhedrovirus]AAR28873.1 vp80 [Leucania separata nucleopolyhedrovirus]
MSTTDPNQMVDKLLSNSLMLQFRTLDLKLAVVQTNGFRTGTAFDVRINDLRRRVNDAKSLITREPAQSEKLMTEIETDLDQLAAETDTFRKYIMPVEQRNELSMPPAPNFPVDPPPTDAPSPTDLEFLPGANRSAINEPIVPPPPDERDATGAKGPAVEQFSMPEAVPGPSGVRALKRKPSLAADESESETNAVSSAWTADLQLMISMLDDMIRKRVEPQQMLTEILDNMILLKQQGERVEHVLPLLKIDIKYIIGNDELQAFLKLYRKYGFMDIEHEPLADIIERIRGTPAEHNQPPTIANFIKTLQRNLKNKVAIKVDRREYEQVTDPDVKLLLEIYNLQSALRIVDKDKPQSSRNGKRTKRSKPSSGNDDFITSPSVANIPLPTEPTELGGPTDAPESIREIMQEYRAEPEIQIALTPFEEPFYELSPESSDVEGNEPTLGRPMSRQRYIDTQLIGDGGSFEPPPDQAQHPVVEALLNVIPPAPSRMAFCELKQHVDIKRFENLFPTVRKLNLSDIDHNVHMYQLLEPLAYYVTDETTFAALGWFIVNTCTYFINAIDNLDSLRMVVVQQGFRDVDRVVLFFIKYNFMLYYRQLISELKSRYRYKNSRVINLLKTYDIIVQKYYNTVAFRFVTPPPNYSQPLDPIVMLILAKHPSFLASSSSSSSSSSAART